MYSCGRSCSCSCYHACACCGRLAWSVAVQSRPRRPMSGIHPGCCSKHCLYSPGKAGPVVARGPWGRPCMRRHSTASYVAFYITAPHAFVCRLSSVVCRLSSCLAAGQCDAQFDMHDSTRPRLLQLTLCSASPRGCCLFRPIKVTSKTLRLCSADWGKHQHGRQEQISRPLFACPPGAAPGAGCYCHCGCCCCCCCCEWNKLG